MGASSSAISSEERLRRRQSIKTLSHENVKADLATLNSFEGLSLDDKIAALRDLNELAQNADEKAIITNGEGIQIITTAMKENLASAEIQLAAINVLYSLTTDNLVLESSHPFGGGELDNTIRLPNAQALEVRFHSQCHLPPSFKLSVQDPDSPETAAELAGSDVPEALAIDNSSLSISLQREEGGEEKGDIAADRYWGYRVEVLQDVGGMGPGEDTSPQSLTNQKRFMAEDGVVAMVNALNEHPTDAELHRAACRLFINLEASMKAAKLSPVLMDAAVTAVERAFSELQIQEEAGLATEALQRSKGATTHSRVCCYYVPDANSLESAEPLPRA